MRIYYEKDADMGLLKGKKVAVIGYGSQGFAHSNNLKESGVDVMVAPEGEQVLGEGSRRRTGGGRGGGGSEGS